MSNHYRRFRAKEAAKLALRGALGRANVSLGRDPFSNQVVRSLTSHDITAVLDVGANAGQYSAQLRSSGFKGRIVSVEPLDSAFAILSRRSASDPQWDVIQSAVGSASGSTVINVSANLYSSSLLDMTDVHKGAFPDSEPVAQQSVDVATVADIVARFDLDPAHTLLKVDTQGFEAEVLKGAGELLNSFAALQLELCSVPLYADQPLYADVAKLVAPYGFELWNLEPGLADESGRLLWCDAFFMRPSGH